MALTPQPERPSSSRRLGTPQEPELQTTSQPALIAALSKRLAAAEKRADAAELRAKQLAEASREQERTLREIEGFLADYGLVWIGGSPRRRPANSSAPAAPRRPTSSGNDHALARSTSRPRTLDPLPQQQQSTKKLLAPFTFDAAKVKRNVAELNIVVGSDVARVQRGPDGVSHQLRVPDPLRFVLYADGIFLLNGPFRSFSDDPSARVFVSDIADGYFPSELQKRHPEGVPLELVDRSAEQFDRSQPPPPCHSTTPPAGSAVGTAGSEKARFERALPTVVIRNGSVVPVRGAVMAMARGDSPAPTSSSSLVIDEECGASSDGGGQKRASIKVAIPCAGAVVRVQLCAGSTLGALLAVVSKHHATPFELFNCETHAVLPKSAPSATVSELGISGVLLRVVCKH